MPCLAEPGQTPHDSGSIEGVCRLDGWFLSEAATEYRSPRARNAQLAALDK